MASYTLHLVATENTPLCSFLPSRDSVPTVDQVIHPIQIVEPTLHSVDPFECLDMYPIWDGLIPSDEVSLESLIQSDLLIDVGSIVTKYNLDFLDNPDLSIDQSSYVDIVESFDSPFEQQVNDPDEFYFSYIFFNS